MRFFFRRFDRTRCGLGIEHRLGQRNATLPVECGVVDATCERHLPALQTLNDRELPQRSVAVQHAFMQLCDQRFKLRLRTGPGQYLVADVVIEIHIHVSEPDGVDQIERHEGEPA